MKRLVTAFLLRRAQLRRRVDADAEPVAEQLTHAGLLNRVSTFLGRDRIELTSRGRSALNRLQRAPDTELREVANGALDPLPYSRFLKVADQGGVFQFLKKQHDLQQMALIHLFWRKFRA